MDELSIPKNGGGEGSFLHLISQSYQLLPSIRRYYTLLFVNPLVHRITDASVTPISFSPIRPWARNLTGNGSHSCLHTHQLCHLDPKVGATWWSFSLSDTRIRVHRCKEIDPGGYFEIRRPGIIGAVFSAHTLQLKDLVYMLTSLDLSWWDLQSKDSHMMESLKRLLLKFKTL